MCGIVGCIAKTTKGKKNISNIAAATGCLSKRGPDDSGIFSDDNISLGHRRLSIIDTSKAGTQPMSDASGRYTIIFNGEFFNFRMHRDFVLSKGYTLKSESDTEVLLYLYIIEGEKCLQRINGFFSVAVFDNFNKELFLARDRFGIKPLLIYEDENYFAFGSEMKALLALGIKKEIDNSSLLCYLQLNYIPQPYSIFKNVRKLKPGTFLKYSVADGRILQEQLFYAIPYKEAINSFPSYKEAQSSLYDLLDKSVQRRLISDVPLGAFLSGGIDSSVITALAARHTNHLKTFSIGFSDEPWFDETHFAKLVSKKHKTDHTVFSLTTNDLFEVLNETLDYIDEPFADSSALNVFILSRYTRKHVTVALSGDGADELFGGYNKHRAEWLIRNDKAFTAALKLLSPLLSKISGSRNSFVGNKIRQINRFGEGVKLSAAERYWRWCGYINEADAIKCFGKIKKETIDDYKKRKNEITSCITGSKDLNDVFYTDTNLVLPGDMLVKVDMMSMANSLEVRTPFLDYEVVDYAFSLPSQYKIDKRVQKKIIKDAFHNLLPVEIYNRGKQGFEVPLLNWFRTELKSKITDDLLNDNFIADQNIFNVEEIRTLRQKLFSQNPGEAVARTWGLIVFQHWWKKVMC